MTDDTTDYAALDWRTVNPATADARTLEVAIAKTSGIEARYFASLRGVGWRLYGTDGTDYSVREIDGEFYPDNRCSEGDAWSVHCPHYTTDPVAALGLLEEMRERYPSLVVRPLGTPCDGWIVIAYDRDNPNPYAGEGTFCEAVSRAYLAAMQSWAKEKP